MKTPSDTTTKTETTETTETTKTTIEMDQNPNGPFNVLYLDLRSAETSAQQIEHSNDGMFCCAPIVGRVCDQHYGAGVLLGSAEAVAVTAVIAVATGQVTPEQAMAAIRESGEAFGQAFPYESWERITRECIRIANALQASSDIVVMKSLEEIMARSQQPELTH